MNTFQALNLLVLGALIGVGIYISRGWKHRTFATMKLHPGEAVTHEYAKIGYAMRGVPGPGQTRATWFHAGLSSATVRVTSHRIVIATPSFGGPTICCVLYRDAVHPEAGTSLSMGYVIGAVRDADVLEEKRDDAVRFELVAQAGSPAERVWLETTDPGPIRAFFGRS